MRVCVVGSGGREHALAYVLGRHHDVVLTPGNPGIEGSVPTPPEELEADLTVTVPRPRWSQAWPIASGQLVVSSSARVPMVPALRGPRPG